MYQESINRIDKVGKENSILENIPLNINSLKI
jgi:hypothetical protein